LWQHPVGPYMDTNILAENAFSLIRFEENGLRMRFKLYNQNIRGQRSFACQAR